ncbi:hypothetical protein [Chitinophaga sp. S165]|uniref:hypothetical protein n=1 Tax=Chitinophaga sp. S165 TaxID=2135462 RepID=UPI000D70A2DF|nr:hypothetical protein [Chitinophaga sp. S165]PWV48321.1 hypothetical protein C7475_107229 [Chitinophaga sp. S165]
MLKPTLLLFITLTYCCCYCFAQTDSNIVTQTVKLVDPLIISERIDGPANVRDKIGGALLFTLNDNVPVETAEETNKWYVIGLILDLSPAQFKSHRIEKGSTLYVNGEAVGTALAVLKLDEVFNEKNKLTGVLTGYTSVQNIRTETLPETVLSRIINQPTVGLAQLKDFIKGYQFGKSTSCGYTSYTLNGGVAYGPSSPIRLELLFNEKNNLFGIVHLRELEYEHSTAYKLNRGFSLTVIGQQPEGQIKAFIKQFNAMINLAD